MDSEESDDIERAAVDEEEDRLTEKNYSSSLHQSSDIHDTVEKNKLKGPDTAYKKERLTATE